MNSAKSQWKRESGRATCRRSAQTRWRMSSVDVGRRGSTIIAFLSNNVAAELNYCQEYHIYLCLSKHFHLAAGLFAFPELPVLPPAAAGGKEGMRGHLALRQEGSPPSCTTCFSVVGENQKALSSIRWCLQCAAMSSDVHDGLPTGETARPLLY